MSDGNIIRSPAGIQELLDNPNSKSPAQSLANQLFTKNKAEYSKRVKAQALQNVPDL